MRRAKTATDGMGGQPEVVGDPANEASEVPVGSRDQGTATKHNIAASDSHLCLSIRMHPQEPAQGRSETL